MAYLVSYTGANGVKAYACETTDETIYSFSFSKEEAFQFSYENFAKLCAYQYNDNESYFIHDFNAAKLPANLLWEIEKI